MLALHGAPMTRNGDDDDLPPALRSLVERIQARMTREWFDSMESNFADEPVILDVIRDLRRELGR